MEPRSLGIHETPDDLVQSALGSGLDFGGRLILYWMVDINGVEIRPP
jgi:hypothetical protein